MFAVSILMCKVIWGSTKTWKNTRDKHAHVSPCGDVYIGVQGCVDATICVCSPTLVFRWYCWGCSVRHRSVCCYNYSCLQLLIGCILKHTHTRGLSRLSSSPLLYCPFLFLSLAFIPSMSLSHLLLKKSTVTSASFVKGTASFPDWSLVSFFFSFALLKMVSFLGPCPHPPCCAVNCSIQSSIPSSGEYSQSDADSEVGLEIGLADPLVLDTHSADYNSFT